MTKDSREYEGPAGEETAACDEATGLRAIRNSPKEGQYQTRLATNSYVSDNSTPSKMAGQYLDTSQPGTRYMTVHLSAGSSRWTKVEELLAHM